MRGPKDKGKGRGPLLPGGKALERLRQFEMARGLEPTATKGRAAAKPPAKGKPSRSDA